MPKRIDLSGKVINHWKINKYLGNQKYNCTCLLCGKDYQVQSYKLSAGLSKSCSKCASKLNGEKQRQKLEGTTVNDWSIIEYLGNSLYLCKCKCGNIEEITSYNLLNNKTHRCRDCNNKLSQNTNREKLEGKQIGKLYIEEYIGSSKYRCKCSCGNTCEMTAYSLKTNKYIMCSDCFRLNWSNMYRESMYRKYGDIASIKINNTRETWQLALLNNKDKLIEYINTFKNMYDRLPTSYELANSLGVSIHILLTYTRQYNINLYTGEISNGEFELREMLKNYNVIYNNRTVIYPQELDIYIPSKKLAIEFNGTYWHSSLLKNRNYHQDKTIACAKQGIHLIHIFEYEWNNSETKKKLTDYICRTVDNSKIARIYARKTIIKQVSIEESKDFLNKNHIQGYASANIRIGLYYNNELIGLMTFGKPRFDNEYQYELIRLAFKSDVSIIGGAEKLFKHFTTEYNPVSIVCYCDISKFTGKVYKRIGFKASVDDITLPNYVWVNPSKNDVLPRYKTMKQKLVKAGLGSNEQTEDEIMTNLGYYKIYNCGNLKFSWYNTKA